MRYKNVLPVWKASPFLRLFPPFIAGLLTQWYLPLPPSVAWITGSLASFGIAFFSLSSLSFKFRLAWINGVALHIMLFTTGVLLLHYKDPRSQTTGIATQYQPHYHLLVTISEPPSEKPKTFKATATVQAFLNGQTLQPTNGKVLLYFQKDSTAKKIQYGDQMIITKTVQPVTHAGNPGAFDFRRYCLFQGILHQVYLKGDDYTMLKIKNENLFKKLLLSTQRAIVATLQRYIAGKRQAGLAEAMLIGYKDDLDKNLLQSYSNTGVVHVIAISGLHLGLIYWLLMLLSKLPGKLKLNKRLQPWVIIAGLWLFSFLAGASPSVLRSALMFTCLIVAQGLQRKTSIYNSLAASAFLLLCYNPFWLWDVGFQLSYAAVLSLSIFMKPIYNLLFFSNKIADSIWKAMAVTLAAQILTVPISVYHFHQFPSFFLIANLLAVPLSGIILFGEILLCVCSFLPVVATMIGFALHHLINCLNYFIETINGLPFASIVGLQINEVQVICLYICITGIGWWLIKNRKQGCTLAVCGALACTLIRSIDVINCKGQQKLIVYNVPQKQAIDLIKGLHYSFIGDSTDDWMMQPTRWLHRATPIKRTGSDLFTIAQSTVLLINKNPHVKPTTHKTPVDLIIISQNPTLNISKLANTFTWRQLVFDNSNSLRNVHRWQQDCAALGLPCHSVANKGAFVFPPY